MATPDIVEQSSFAMVNVAKDCNDRGTIVSHEEPHFPSTILGARLFVDFITLGSEAGSFFGFFFCHVGFFVETSDSFAGFNKGTRI